MVNACFNLILLLVFFCENTANCAKTFKKNSTGKPNKIFLKSVGCTEVNPKYIGAHKCFFKPTRDGSGLVTFQIFNSTKWDELWVHYQLFYKYGTRYRQWMMNWETDLCAFLESGAILNSFFGDWMGRMLSTLNIPLTECPFGPFTKLGLERFNYADLIECILPQVIPSGTYRVNMRYFRKSDNDTYLIASGTAEVRAVDAMQKWTIG